ncbi:MULTISPECIES: phage tail tube protein [Pseudomonadati]|uniref:Phage tail protein n=3 Tax=Pseudomonadati TaxID=3379134 RepID=A0A7K0GN97_PARDI|nr:MULTISPECIES: phage tail protein [Bacteria]MTN76951.1 phage tail protein [Turicibacter sanguinis]KAB5324044.1 phage tail protein [Bacteroides stercoris]MRY60423.1 phage tail protein [Parabacteroides distasonis]MRY69681.1 phage tail protein [Parabacteroides distasonis]MSA33693.1 phage tail protein [Parabacteroides distasonis]
MARNKNAKRGHFVAEFDPSTPAKEPTEWLEVAKWITTISDDTDEETDKAGYYDGDGNVEEEVIGVSEAWTVAGTYDPEDKAQALIVSKKRKVGDGRKLWHKIVESDNKKQWVGVATATGIKGGGGDATAYEEFGCKLAFKGLPKESAVPGV